MLAEATTAAAVATAGRAGPKPAAEAVAGAGRVAGQNAEEDGDLGGERARLRHGLGF